jgi:hypothetical protein
MPQEHLWVHPLAAESVRNTILKSQYFVLLIIYLVDDGQQLETTRELSLLHVFRAVGK